LQPKDGCFDPKKVDFGSKRGEKADFLDSAVLIPLTLRF
jgi:hypothetical protein